MPSHDWVTLHENEWRARQERIARSLMSGNTVAADRWANTYHSWFRSAMRVALRNLERRLENDRA